MKKVIVVIVMLMAPVTICAEEWELVVKAGITGWGVGSFSAYTFPSEDSCYKALDKTRVTGQKQVSGDDDEQTIILCRPKVATD